MPFWLAGRDEYKEPAAWIVFVLMVILVVTAVSKGQPDGWIGWACRR